MLTKVHRFIEQPVKTLLSHMATNHSSLENPRYHTGENTWYNTNISLENQENGLEESGPEKGSESESSHVSLPRMSNTDTLHFYCPKCGRCFIGDWSSCQAHVVSRKHGTRCSYPFSSSTSGWHDHDHDYDDDDDHHHHHYHRQQQQQQQQQQQEQQLVHR